MKWNGLKLFNRHSPFVFDDNRNRQGEINAAEECNCPESDETRMARLPVRRRMVFNKSPELEMRSFMPGLRRDLLVPGNEKSDDESTLEHPRSITADREKGASHDRSSPVGRL